MKKDWHTRRINELFQYLYTSEEGLSEKEAKERLKKFGTNEIIRKKRFSSILIFFRQFKSFLVFLLIAAATISFLLGKKDDGIIISAVIFINTVIGFLQEYKAEKTMEAIKNLTVQKTRVIREGKEKIIPSKFLVPGDIIVVEEGNKIPADSRIIESINLMVDESALTGESIPVEKEAKILDDIPLQERKNMLFLGTMVVYGRGKAVVVDTGMQTELGRIAGMIETEEKQTPLQARIEELGKWLVFIAVFFSSLIFLFGVIAKKELYQLFFTAIALSVSAVPEGLPAVVTITLALGVNRMSKKNAIIRKISAVETLGCTTVIATDKTGTITSNEMTVRKIFVKNKTVEVSGIGFEPYGDFYVEGKKINPREDSSLNLILEACVLCNSASILRNGNWLFLGDPMDRALLVLSAKAGIWKNELEKKYEKVVEIPFSSERKLMVVVYSKKDESFIYVKGVPEKILEICSFVHEEGKMTPKRRKELDEEIRKMARDGLRVIGIAYKKVSGKVFSTKEVDIKDLAFLGFLGMQDPPRENIREAIEKCNQAGIRVIMLTGDHKETASKIAKEVGILESEKIVTGNELDKMSEEEIKDVVGKVNVYARVLPEHKLKIVRSLRERGEIVAVTGDGVNDAPALKEADLGIAMGIRGTDVAKEASDIILTDDNFITIVSAVEEGRKIYDNIRKSLRYALSVNFSEIFLILTSILVGLPLPLLPIQILWLNLITDTLPALSLSVEKGDEYILKRKPRNPKESIFHGMTVFMIAAGSLCFLVEFFVFVFQLYRSVSFTYTEIAKARTMCLSVAVMFELFFVFNCRLERGSIFKTNPFSNKYLLVSVIISFLLHLSIIYFPPFSHFLNTVPLGLNEFVLIVLLSSLSLILSPSVFLY
ncbi:MAG: cation-translocating P-type ATPase [Candidatus Aenigmatarchaeota archaeon]